MSVKFILIQIIGFCGTILYLVSFQFKNNKNLFRMQFIAYIMYTIHMILLGAITGGVSYIINGARSYFLSSNNEFFKSKYMCVIICIMQLIVLCITWAGWISLLPVIANIATTIGGYTRNPQKFRFCAIFINSPLCIIYNVIVGSVAGVVDELISEVSMIVSVIRYGWKNLDVVEE